MHISSVRALKEELRGRHTAPASVVEALRLSRPSPALARALAGTHTRPVDQAPFSLGLARGRSKRDFRLGVRIHTAADEAQKLATRLARKSRGEADIRIVPEVSAGPRLHTAARGAWFRKRRRPLEAGLSLGHYAITAGTLGFVVEDDDAYYALSNNHVLADVNKGRPGDPVVQPAPADSRTQARNLVGVLDRYVPISFQRANVVDCAVAQILPDLDFYVGWTEALPGRVVGHRAVSEDDLDAPVMKVGRTTGVTRGRISLVEVDRLVVNMNTPDEPAYAQFSDQFEVTGHSGAFSLGGDSGSLIVDSEGFARGLLFAGGPDEDGEELTFANPIRTVLSKLGVELAL